MGQATSSRSSSQREHPGRAAGRGRRQERRQARDARGCRGVPQVPLQRRGAGDRRASHHYRPRDAAAFARHAAQFPKIKVISVDEGVRRVEEGAGHALRRRRDLRPDLSTWVLTAEAGRDARSAAAAPLELVALLPDPYVSTMSWRGRAGVVCGTAGLLFSGGVQSAGAEEQGIGPTRGSSRPAPKRGEYLLRSAADGTYVYKEPGFRLESPLTDRHLPRVRAGTAIHYV